MIKTVYGKTPDVERAVFVAENAAIIGAVTLGEGTSVWYGAVLRADSAAITVGESSNIQDNVTLHTEPEQSIQIGNHVSVGHNAILHGCVVEDGVLIGMHATVMNGCHIGAGSIIGAGTLLTQNTFIPPHSMVVGSPGKVLRPVTPREFEENLENALRYTANGAEHAKV